MADLSVLTRPFDNIRSREGAGGKHFSYVAGADILARILEATQGMYDWEIIDLRLIDGQAKANKKTGEVYTTPAVWMVHGRLTMPGLGSRDGVGTAIAENEDSPKGAETDAMKRAAVKFGVALDLYQADAHASTAGTGGNGRQPAAATPAKMNNTGSKCAYCTAPDGKPHLPTCPTRQQAAA